MNTSDEGIKAIEQFEGLRLDAYQDSVGVWTIGVGHTKGVHGGLTITQEDAENLLREDLKDAENAVNFQVKVPLAQGQFDALVSFVFNLGAGALASSTLLRLLNSGDYDGAREQFKRWDKAGGVELPGLLARRNAEAEMFA